MTSAGVKHALKEKPDQAWTEKYFDSLPANEESTLMWTKNQNFKARLERKENPWPHFFPE